MGLPDKLGLHWVVERHKHLCILTDLTHHVLQSHKQGKRWSGSKLCLSGQINILLLRLLEGNSSITFTIGHSSKGFCRTLKPSGLCGLNDEPLNNIRVGRRDTVCRYGEQLHTAAHWIIKCQPLSVCLSKQQVKRQDLTISINPSQLIIVHSTLEQKAFTLYWFS